MKGPIFCYRKTELVNRQLETETVKIISNGCHSEQSEESVFLQTRDSSVIKLPQNDILQMMFYPYSIAGLIIGKASVLTSF